MDPRVSVIEKRLQGVKRIICVASGKGGVGKSLISSLIAVHLSKKGLKVGLLDLDLYGPSLHIILGIEDLDFPEEKNGILPRDVRGIKFMSIVYFTKDKPFALRGKDVTNIIIELLAITQWGELDYLIIDMPPGIGEEVLDIVRLIKRGEFIVVSTPSKVSIGAVVKLLKILKEIESPIIGVIENMKMKESNYVEKEISKLSLKCLGSISLDEDMEDAIGDIDKLYKTRSMKELSKAIEGI